MQGILTFNIQIEFWFGLMLLCLAYIFLGDIDMQWKINIWFIEIILKKGTCENISKYFTDFTQKNICIDSLIKKKIKTCVPSLKREKKLSLNLDNKVPVPFKIQSVFLF